MTGDDILLQARLWWWQRTSAMALAFCVLVHLGVIIYAVHAGLSAASLLGRTRGNVVFGAFYTLFVLACAIHAPIGLMNVAREWLGWRPRPVGWLAAAFALAIVVLGLRAVYGVVVA